MNAIPSLTELNTLDSSKAALLLLRLLSTSDLSFFYDLLSDSTRAELAHVCKGLMQPDELTPLQTFEANELLLDLDPDKGV